LLVAQAAESAAAQHLSDDAKNMDKLLAQRVIFATKREDCNKKIRELGALPRESFDQVRLHFECVEQALNRGLLLMPFLCTACAVSTRP
jgi:hypothetical protein